MMDPTLQFRERGGGIGPPAAAAALAAVLLVPAQLAVEPPLLLAERFVPGAGWAEIAFLAAWAAAAARLLSHPRRAARWRRRLWGLFSLVFFGQLALGLAGLDRFLMTGRLHLPVPALVVAGPLYRAGGFVMLGIYGASLLVLGRAWCSHLCYLGAWDSAAASLGPRPRPLPRWRHAARAGLLGAVAAAALGLNLAGVGPRVATALAAVFAAAGLAVMALVTTRTGQMAHCAAFCPLGALTSWIGLLSPFRIRLGDRCTGCGACSGACRADALTPRDIEARRPAASCTLCGDCIGACPHGAVETRFLFLSPRRARALFVVLAAGLHAVFLGTARI